MSWSVGVRLASKLIPVLAVSLVSAIDARAEGPTTSVQTEYLMTFYANLDTAQLIDAGMQIIPVTGGWVEGPRIKGKIVPPGGDWGHVLPSGVFRLDVRATIRTDDVHHKNWCRLTSRAANGTCRSPVNYRQR
jgi:Protein of unknown function (DUF3237)